MRVFDERDGHARGALEGRVAQQRTMPPARRARRRQARGGEQGEDARGELVGKGLPRVGANRRRRARHLAPRLGLHLVRFHRPAAAAAAAVKVARHRLVDVPAPACQQAARGGCAAARDGHEGRDALLARALLYAARGWRGPVRGSLGGQCAWLQGCDDEALGEETTYRLGLG